VARADFNSYGSRRGNHEVMIRGTFANIRLRNRLAAVLGLWGRRVIGEEIGTFQRLLGQFPELLGQMAQEQLHSVLTQGAVSRMRGLGLRV